VPPFFVEPGRAVVEQVSQCRRVQGGAFLDLLGAVVQRLIHRRLDAGERPVQQPAQRHRVVPEVGDQMPAAPALQQRGAFELVVGERGEALREERGAAPSDDEPLGQFQIVETHRDRPPT